MDFNGQGEFLVMHQGRRGLVYFEPWVQGQRTLLRPSKHSAQKNKRGSSRLVVVTHGQQSQSTGTSVSQTRCCCYLLLWSDCVFGELFMSVLSCEFTVTYQDMRLEFSVTVTSVIFLENVMNFFFILFVFSAQM